jgi:hypothetical protein
MTAQTITELEACRRAAAERAEQITDAIDRMPTEELHRQLREVTLQINRLDRRIEEARRSR